MKQGMQLDALVAELNRRADAKRDFIIDTREVGFDRVGEDDDQKWVLDVPGNGFYAITDHAHSQISQRIGIPKRYYDRMLTTAPELLKDNVRHWFDSDPERRMIRTLDHNARAFLSDRYRRLDNEQVAAVALPAITSVSNAVLLSSHVTDRKLYLKTLFPDIVAEVTKDDVVRPGVIISNSEIGQGALDVQYFFYRDFCTNGCVFGKRDVFGMKRYHTGSVVAPASGYEIFSDDTQRKEDDLILSQVSDVVEAATSSDLFMKEVEHLRAAAASEKMQNPVAGVEALGKVVGLSLAEQESALINLLEGRDYTKWGALNAVTKIANTAESYDRASELEELGGAILDITNSEWKRIVNSVQAEKLAV